MMLPREAIRTFGYDWEYRHADSMDELNNAFHIHRDESTQKGPANYCIDTQDLPQHAIIRWDNGVLNIEKLGNTVARDVAFEMEICRSEVGNEPSLSITPMFSYGRIDQMVQTSPGSSNGDLVFINDTRCFNEGALDVVLTHDGGAAMATFGDGSHLVMRIEADYTMQSRLYLNYHVPRTQGIAKI